MNDKETSGHILIVDDTLKNIQVLGAILRREGFQINVAQNGQQALESVQRVSPDLILLDIVMPVMDGFWVDADATILTGVFKNLIKNGVEHVEGLSTEDERTVERSL